METSKKWKYLKLSGCYFMDYLFLFNLNCEILDLTDTTLIYDLCEHKKYCVDIFNVLKKCKTLYLSRYYDKDRPVYLYDDIVTDTLSQIVVFVDQHLYLSHDDAEIKKPILTKSQYDLLSIERAPPTAIVVPDDFAQPFFGELLTSGKSAQDIFPATFNPPGFVSICKNYYYDTCSPAELIDKYQEDRQIYIKSLIVENNDQFQKRTLSKRYNFTVYFFNILRTMDRMVGTKHELYFRKYNPVRNGMLGPLYYDCDYFSDNSYDFSGSSKYDKISENASLINSLTKLIVTVENSVQFDHKSIMTNEEYYLRHNNKCVYMDIMAALEEECFFPPRLSAEEYLNKSVTFVDSDVTIKEIKEKYSDKFITIKDNPMTLREMQCKYNMLAQDYQGASMWTDEDPYGSFMDDDDMYASFENEQSPIVARKNNQSKIITENKINKIIELIMKTANLMTETIIKMIIKLFDILLH